MRTSFKIGFLEYLLIGLGAGICFAQAPMPPTNNVSPLIETNTITEGNYTMTQDALGQTQDEVNAYGIVWFVGTNIVKIDSVATTVNNNISLISDPDHNEHIQINRKENWLYSSDLITWQTNCTTVFLLYDLPYQQQQFFRFSNP